MKIRLILVALLGAAAIAAGAVWSHFGDYFLQIYQQRRYPSIKEKSPLGADIEKEARWRRYQAVLKRYRKVEGMLDRAETGGRADAPALRARLPTVAKYMDSGKFDWAEIHLNSIEMHLGRRPAGEVRVLGASDFGGGQTASPKAKKSRKKAVKRSKTRKKTR